jgi:hypothetical protein
MNTALKALTIYPLVSFILAALWIAAVEAHPGPRCSCGKRSASRRCMDCTERLALSATIPTMSQR